MILRPSKVQSAPFSNSNTGNEEKSQKDQVVTASKPSKPLALGS